jgi:uncharacterized membrane protein
MSAAEAITIGATARVAPDARDPLAPELVDKFLAAAAIVLLAAVLAAVARGYGEWGQVPAIVWAHVATIIVAVGLTPIMLLRPRGDRLHRTLGWTWAVALFLAAALSFGVTALHPGHWSYIHLLSLFTMFQVPFIVVAARRHNWKRHRAAVRGMVTGGLVVAGFFTFSFGRLLGHWLLG